MSAPAREIRFLATRSSGEVSALLIRPRDAFALYVFSHGAGAGMRHVFMEEFSQALAKHGVATFRYHFPYMEAGRRAPSPRPVLLKTVRAAVHAAGEAAPDLPRFAGGKSMGGRMTSMAAAAESLPEIRGLVFVGFPLHPAGRESTDRGDHLADVSVPLLFLQGTRDKLAQLDLLRPIVSPLDCHATLHEVEGADHGFSVLKRSGRTDADVMRELAETSAAWMRDRA
ncbi:MAG: alpha/beta family hydrolase [Planctomycetota bacterium]